MGKRGPKPKGRIRTAWSPSLAYAVGLITTDGNLSGDGRHIEFTSKDKDLVMTFQTCLDLKDVKVGSKHGGYNNALAYRIQFGDVLFYEWLTKIGLSPNKSKIIPALDIPDEYFFDFLRGCFDGDGHINAYWDPRWHSSYMFYIGFTSASRVFLEWIGKTIERLLGYKTNIKQGTRAYQLCYAKAASKVLFNSMFYTDDIPHLERKFAKAQEILRIDNDHNARVL